VVIVSFWVRNVVNELQVKVAAVFDGYLFEALGVIQVLSLYRFRAAYGMNSVN
jgi:hypothetical protein